MQRNRKSPTGTPATTTAANTSPVVTSFEILTVAEVAALLKVPRSSIYEWTRFRGTPRTPIPHRKIGKYLRFLEREIREWFETLPQSRNIQKRKYARKPK